MCTLTESNPLQTVTPSWNLPKEENIEFWLLKMKQIDNYNFWSLNSKLVVRDEIVRECLFMCNQIFDRQKYFHCVANSDDIWMVWNFHQKKSNEDNDIIAHVPKKFNVHHVVVETFQETPFWRCDWFLYEMWVECITWIHVHVEFIYIYELMFIRNLYI